jgi:hypothetical protein
VTGSCIPKQHCRLQDYRTCEQAHYTAFPSQHPTAAPNLPRPFDVKAPPIVMLQPPHTGQRTHRSHSPVRHCPAAALGTTQAVALGRRA